MTRRSFSWTGSSRPTVIPWLTQRTSAAWDGFAGILCDTASGDDVPGTVLGVPDWGDISWAHDSSGFYYGGYGSELPRKPELPVGDGYRIFFHRVGTAQSEDRLVYDHADHPEWLAWANESRDGRYLILERLSRVREATAGRLRSAISASVQTDRKSFAGSELANTTTSTTTARLFYFFTNSRAPHGKLVAIDLRNPSLERDVIPQRSAVLEGVNAVGGRFTALYLRDVNSLLDVFARSGKLLHAIALPGIGSASNVFGNAGDPIGYYRFSSLTDPPTVFSYNVRTNQSAAYSQAGTPFDPAKYVTEELFATSTGGARIPVFIGHRRDIKLDGDTPTLLTGYGGFGDSYTPGWQKFTAAWLARGGVVAIACVRGGGEYGEDWHRAGMLGNKQHAFDDFAAAAQSVRSIAASPLTRHLPHTDTPAADCSSASRKSSIPRSSAPLPRRLAPSTSCVGTRTAANPRGPERSGRRLAVRTSSSGSTRMRRSLLFKKASPIPQRW